VAGVFISYAHEDNESPPYPSKGWVERFYDTLKARLAALRREENTSVWLDVSGRITGSTVLTPTIQDELSQSGALVLILSPAYRGSKWCADELKFFRDATAQNGGLTVVTKDKKICRVFKVLKVPINVPVRAEDFRTGVPEIDDSPGYPFFATAKDGTNLELDPPISENFPGLEFSRAIVTLASDINQVLQSISDGKSKPPSGGETPASTVIYLADTTSDMASYRESIRQELEQFGSTVVPSTQRFPDAAYAGNVKEDLGRAALSIHLVGKPYGMIPEGSSDSIVELQYKLAAEEGRARPDFARLVWMPPGTDGGDERQKAFVASLQDEPGFKIAPLETFKTIVQDTLEASRRKKQAGDAVAKGVYLIFDIPDQETAKEIDGWLLKRGFKVWKRTQDEQEQLAIDLHRDRLEVSSGVIIYYGLARDSWLQSMLLRLTKDFALKEIGRKPCGVVVADPERPGKNDISDPDVEVIPGFGGFSAERLERFVQELERQPASP